jgi:hypothetical protein
MEEPDLRNKIIQRLLSGSATSPEIAKALGYVGGRGLVYSGQNASRACRRIYGWRLVSHRQVQSHRHTEGRIVAKGLRHGACRPDLACSYQQLVTDVHCGEPAFGIISSDSAREVSERLKMASANQLLRRRSVRMTLNTPIGISGEDRGKTSFSVSAKATDLNRHGAAVQLSRELLVGTTVLVRNKRGTQISARIVAQISAVQGGLHTYGIEFVEEDAGKLNNFWGIVFPAAT